MYSIDKKIKLIAGGSTKAFKDFYDSFFPSLAFFSIQLVKDKDEASDIVQEAFLTYWNKRNEFENLDGVKAFMYTVIKNSGLNYLRSQKVHAKHLAYIEQNERNYFKNIIIEEETISMIKAALTDLPPQTKNIVELSMLGAKNVDIAETLGVSINTVKTLKLRAYKLLREKLKNHVYVLLILSDILLK
ncbi:RNA polymerase sigma-70 factor [Saccharicrinis fermentans]|uniref:RNA polymerase sigma factor SigV n=1 Tax=Saccharicrinis fermentans DSM 9555 = JCM 21142 TaxID=869213 RepID=W7YA62_9BACT|nr:RNA polymerase sigma-70 factor [Saccharicrinis fermentans]GAF05212.1 RNA polymerase sigma factor SigV [Saccharicrinis fermentans DSM 9555 = JCM 21142]